MPDQGTDPGTCVPGITLGVAGCFHVPDPSTEPTGSGGAGDGLRTRGLYVVCMGGFGASSLDFGEFSLN